MNILAHKLSKKIDLELAFAIIQYFDNVSTID